MDRIRSNRSERARQERGRLGACLVLAVLIHLAFIPILGWLAPVGHEPAKRFKRHVVSLRPSNASSTNQKRASKQPKRQEEKQKKPERKEPLPKGTIVNLPPDTDRDQPPPDDARFLSEHNTRTDKETKSRHMRTDYRNAMNVPTEAKKQEKSSKTSPQPSTGLALGPDQPTPSPQPTTAPNTALSIPKLKVRDQLALEQSQQGKLLNQSKSEEFEGKGQQLVLSLGAQPADSGAALPPTGSVQSPKIQKFIPSMAELSRISGAPASHVLDDVEEGEGTFLNSKRFKYASFFNRVHRNVAQNWNPLPVYRQRDPTGNVYGHRTRITTLTVTLKANGKLREIGVARSSGISFLDREALAAFQRAQPFPNPPKGLMGETGEISFHFSFHLVVSPDGITVPPF